MKKSWIRYGIRCGIRYVCCVCVLPTLLAQDDWELQRGVVTSSNLKDVQFVDTQRGWAVGDGGVILHTRDGGQQWNRQYVAVSSIEFRDVHFVDAERGWVVGGFDPVVFHTNDGGNIWIKQAVRMPHVVLTAVYFVDADTGWVLGSTGGGPSIIRTTDGGRTWARQTTPFRVGDQVLFKDLHFVSVDTGWVVGSINRRITPGRPTGDRMHYMLYTEDGGTTWTEQLRAPERGGLNAVHFVNASVGWAVGEITKTTGVPGMSLVLRDSSYVLHTVNGGLTWEEQRSGKTDRLRHENVYFVDAMRGWMSNNGSFIWRTVNGGVRWEKQGLSGATNISVYFANASTGWAVSNGGVILHTNDGMRWTPQSKPFAETLYDVQFVDDEEGWTVGQRGLILHTTNGGTQWDEQTTPSTVSLRSLHFVDADTGWVVGHGGTILHTEDGGADWTAQTSGTSQDLLDVHFVDTDTGWAVGKVRTLLHTTDGGINWAPQRHPYTEEWDFETVHFYDADTGWAGGGTSIDGGIVCTKDGGATWTICAEALGARVRALSFLDGNRGAALTAPLSFLSSVMYYTEDGGRDRWGTASTSTQTGINALDAQMINADSAFLVRYSGTSGGSLALYVRPRPGRDASLKFSSTVGSVPFHALYFRDKRRGWLVGEKGVIAKTTRGGVSSVFLRTSVARYAWDYQEQSVELRVASNASWTLSDGDADWIRLEDAAGNAHDGMLSLMNNQAVTVHCTENTGTQPRIAMLTLRTTSGSAVVDKVLRVEQSAAAATLNVMVVPATLPTGVTLMTLPPATGFFNMMVTSNASWRVSTAASWVSLLGMNDLPLREGMGSAVLKVSYTENVLIAMREAVLRFTLMGSTRPSEEIHVIQLASSPALSLAPSAVLPALLSAEASRHAFELGSNTAWSLTVSEAWARFVDTDNVPVTSGTGDKDLVLVVDVNRLSSIRRVTIGGMTTLGTPVAMLSPLTIQQAAASLPLPPALSLAPSAVLPALLSAEASRHAFELRSNTAWSLTVSEAWARFVDADNVLVTSGTGDKDVVLVVDVNRLSSIRRVMIGGMTTLGTPVAMLSPRSIQQAAASLPLPPALSLAPSATLPALLSAEASRHAFELGSNTAWSLTVSEAWARFVDADNVPVTSGTGDKDVVLVVDVNRLSSIRRVTIGGMTTLGTPVAMLSPLTIQQAAASLPLPPALSLAPSAVLPALLSAEASRHAFELRSNTAWSLTVSEAWARFVDADNVPVTSGTGDKDVVLVVDVNRLSSIRRVTIGGMTTLGTPVAMLSPRSIQQAAASLPLPPALSLAPSAVLPALLSAEASRHAFELGSNTAWSLTVSEAWVRFVDADNVPVTSGTGDKDVVLVVDVNRLSSTRRVTIGGMTTLGTPVAMLSPRSIQQAAASLPLPPALSLAPSAVLPTLLSAEASRHAFELRSNTTWSLTVSEAWARFVDADNVLVTSGTGDKDVVLVVDVNRLSSIRRVTIGGMTTLGTPVAMLSPRSIQQAAASLPLPPALSLAPSAVLPALLSAGASRHAFELRSNTTWSLTVSEAWARFVDADNVPVTSGTGDKDLVLVVDANRLSSIRRVTIGGMTTVGVPVAMLSARSMQQEAARLTGLLAEDTPRDHPTSEFSNESTSESTSKPTVHMYPNPAEYRVSITVDEEAHLRLRNRHGEVLSTHTLRPGQVLELDLDNYEYKEGLGEGVYFVEVQTVRGRVVRRLVLK